MNFSEKLIELRKEKGLSQEDLAYELEVPRQIISNWETNLTMPDVQSLLKLSKLFQISIDDLLDNDYHTIKKTNNNHYFLSGILWTISGICFLMATTLYFNPLQIVVILLDTILAITNFYKKKPKLGFFVNKISKYVY